MSSDYKVYENTSLSDIFKKIDENSQQNKIQITTTIQELMTYIKDSSSAMQLFPMIAEYMEANIRNDELLVKLAAVVQRVQQAEAKAIESDFGLSESEKEQLLSKVEQDTANLQKEIDDISLQLKD
jgi:hypothetical protein